MNKSSNISLLESIVNLFVASLNPSIASSVDDELASFSYDLKSSPQTITNLQTQEKLKTLIKKRIKLDRAELQDKTDSLNNILDELSNKILTLMEQSSVSKDKISDIKEELKSEPSSSFKDIKDRLISIASSLEVEASSLSMKMKKDSDLVKNLQKRVHKLEVALNRAKKESKIDFLTNTLSRRALDNELKITKESYERYHIEYTIVFFDLDNFKMINDTYGHTAGDMILKSIGDILNKNKREVDIIGRFGGEEFLAILPKTNLAGAITFATKVKEAVEEHSFLYKDERIFITISAGIASRVDYKNHEDTMKNADMMLYNSKNLGRNRVSPSIP
jgi:diguanylate cyclase (GGDEF)-like protein